jgi:hypothetical protein
MIASDEMEAFLRDGFGRYADAREAVEAFERELQERLLAMIEAKKDWKNFQPKVGERGRGKSRDAGVFSAATGRGVWTNHASANADGGWIDFGLWWRSPRVRDGVVLHCSFRDAGYRLRGVSLADPTPPVICGPIDPGKARLYVVFDGSLDLNAMGRLLLDEMDRALPIRPASPAT